MARRHRDWNVGLAEDLSDREFAREFLLGAIDEGVPLQVALAKVVRAMGVKEFAAKVGMASPNLVRALNPRHNPTQDTLNRLLKPFRLKLSLALSRIDRSAGTQRRVVMKSIDEAEARVRLDELLDEARRQAIVIRRQGEVTGVFEVTNGLTVSR